jgi:ribulose bisphosphate carboxylase small subunit
MYGMGLRDDYLQVYSRLLGFDDAKTNVVSQFTKHFPTVLVAGTQVRVGLWSGCWESALYCRTALTGTTF